MSKSIITYTGKRVWPLDIRLYDIDVNDFAHSLSNLCRFTGHTREFYSVAQHLCLCYDIAEDHRLWLLLHDAPEAYLNDIARPLKHSEAYDAYRTSEDKIMRVMCQKFGLPWPEPPYVKEIDDQLLRTEIRDLMTVGRVKTNTLQEVEPLPEKIKPWLPKDAKHEYRRRLRKEGLL